MESELRTFVLADATVAGLIVARMYPLALPQNPTLPAIAYQRISTARKHQMSGPDGVPRAYEQITCWATTYAVARSLANAVRVRLDGYRGAWGAVSVGSAMIIGDYDTMEPDTGRQGVILELAAQIYE